MFQKLYEYSMLLPESKTIEYLNEGMPAVYDHGLAVCFDENGKYDSVKVLRKNKEVIYRSGPSNGTDYTPCCKLAKSTNKRLPKAVKALLNSKELTKEKEWLSRTIEDYEEKIEIIWNDIDAQVKKTKIDGKKHRGYVFWAKLENGSVAPVFQWDCCKQHVQNSVLSDWKKRGGSRKNGACFICGKTQREVFGNYSVLACYNLDKIGCIAGGFKEKYGAKNFPVCSECGFRVSGAVVRVTQDLTSTMAGQSYLILPYSNSDEVREEIIMLLTKKNCRFKLNSQQQFDLLSQEQNFLEDFEDYSDQMAFALIFFKQEKAAWRIQAEIQQVLPSRMKTLHAAAEAVSLAEDLFYTSAKGEKVPMVVSANMIRNFSQASDHKSEEVFRAWLVALFENKSVNYTQFIKHLVKRIIHVGRKDSALMPWTVFQAWAFFRYACSTRLIIVNQKGACMKNAVPESPYGEYILKHPGFFNRPEKAVAFLTGCYMAVVTFIQWKKRKSAPFAKKFVGRLLQSDQLKKLYYEGHAKLAQYDALGLVARIMDPDLAQAWVTCGDDWNISSEEATFAFTIGYSLEYRIREMSENKELAKITEYQKEARENESN